MISVGLMLAIGMASIIEPGAPSSKEALQLRLDQAGERCNAGSDLRLKALSADSAMIAFDEPPLDLSTDKNFNCVLAEINKIGRISVGVIGREQYIDDEGNRN